MSVMDSIEEKYEEQIAVLKKEVAALRKDYNRTVDERDNAYFEIERLKFGQKPPLCPRTDKREGKNIWWYLFSFWPNYRSKGKRWRGHDLFHARWWRYNDYIFHDSFGKFWNRFVRCPLFGHIYQSIEGDNGKYREYCFKCEIWKEEWR